MKTFTPFLPRMRAADRPGTLSEITRILGGRGISIEAFIQKEPGKGEQDVDIIMLTQRVREGTMNGAIAAIESLAVIDGDVTRIRVESLG